MIAFEIYKNGQRQFTAGAADYQTLISTLTLIHPSHPDTRDHVVLFGTTGIVPKPFKSAYWPECDLVVGDRVEIRIIETDAPDVPSRIEASDPYLKPT